MHCCRSPVACGDDDDPAGAGDSFSASLSGAEEVPPVTTTATGTATFDIVGDQISYTVGTPAITFDALVEAMRAGNAYVNVHTDNGTPPPNTGAGDMASGEICGQIVAD